MPRARLRWIMPSTALWRSRSSIARAACGEVAVTRPTRPRSVTTRHARAHAVARGRGRSAPSGTRARRRGRRPAPSSSGTSKLLAHRGDLAARWPLATSASRVLEVLLLELATRGRAAARSPRGARRARRSATRRRARRPPGSASDLLHGHRDLEQRARTRLRSRVRFASARRSASIETSVSSTSVAKRSGRRSRIRSSRMGPPPGAGASGGSEVSSGPDADVPEQRIRRGSGPSPIATAVSGILGQHHRAARSASRSRMSRFAQQGAAARHARCPCRRCPRRAPAACARARSSRLDDRVDRLLQRLAAPRRT